MDREQGSKDWWDLLSALALLFAMLIVAARLVATGWVRNLDLVATVTLLGVFAGLALGKSIFARWVVFLFALAYGIFVIPWQLGLTLGVDLEWIERLRIMAERTRAILADIILRNPVTDNLFFLLLMATIFWIVSVYAGYQLVRNGDVWRAMLPGGIAIFAIHHYDSAVERRSWYLAAYVFFTLLILARTYFLHQRRSWQSRRTFVPPDISFDLSRFTLLITLIIVLMAWNSPALADSLSPVSNLYRFIEKPWLEAKEEISFLFASLRATVGLVTDYYADEQPLGLGNVNTDEEVMEITAPRVSFVGHRFYWRARVYDSYEEGRWTSSVKESVEFNPSRHDLLIPDGGEREVVTVEITPREALITLYSPTQPIWYSRPGDLYLTQLEDGTVDVVNMEARPLVRPGETYQVRASVANVTQKALREAGVDYPQWVLDRYLQLPEDITPRTRLLAERLAEGAETPYDVVERVTYWLRENIEYIERIEEPPSDQELIDWFLFEYQKGFCNYYSSAMVILLRSVGIPARWAVGYAQGLPQIGQVPNMPEQLRGQLPDVFFADQQIYTVRQLDAHSWPEVYFPGIGWVEFEPTVSQTPLLRPRGEIIASAEELSEDLFRPRGLDDLPIPEEFPEGFGAATEVEPEAKSSSYLVVGAMFVTLGVFGLVVALWARRSPDRVLRFIDQVYASVNTPFPVYLNLGIKKLGLQAPAFIRRWAYQATLSPVSRSFLEVNNALSRMGAPPLPSSTPLEQVQLLCNLLPAVRKDALTLLEQYQLETYGAKQVNREIAAQAGEAIRRQSIQFWFERIINQVIHPLQKLSETGGK